MIRQDASTGQVIDDGKGSGVSDKNLFELKVYSPYKIYFEGKARSISALNETGPFDILGQHQNFMTLVSACTLGIDTPYGSQDIAISKGIMHVKADEVTVFLDV
jgi:F0F1-type ATP synthase epsilon subunit